MQTKCKLRYQVGTSHRLFAVTCQFFCGETAISCLSLDNFSDYSVTIIVWSSPILATKLFTLEARPLLTSLMPLGHYSLQSAPFSH